jgi:valyl-tRNA synthetase
MKLSKVYEPKQYEPNIYALWESGGVFAPAGEGEPYTILMPPPNANASLHIGHALTVAIQDILIRYYRMNGRRALYIPGADHAGFETWVVFEKKLEAEGRSRFEISREEIYNSVWDFVESNRGVMELQLRELGASASWEHGYYTLDKRVIDTVYNTFQKLWEDKLIYRGERIVNYCTKHQTSFADIEVKYKNEQSKIWRIAYPVLEGDAEIIVATTRPETMLGDTAVAVHPDDKRYKDLIGKHVVLPLVNREIPIVADDAVDPDFGTGAVKVTPAHDPVDFEIGERHNLERIQVIGFDGNITDEAPDEFRGLEVLVAREQVLSRLAAEEDLRGEEDYEHSVGHCYKCGTPIQPLLKDQWFLKVQPLAQKAVEVIKDKQITFTPSSKKEVIIRYLNELKDWNLSRQIPWGIPIPAFQNVEDPDDWIFDTRVDQPEIEVGGKKYRRDDDTFDTWFSSGQLPYIVTDYVTDGPLKDFYPTDLMETGHDILRPWVARMIMLGLYVANKIPFKHVYMHGMVTDEHGQKMSKSKGNVINPQEVLDQFGSDALRMGIVANRSAGQNQAFSIPKVIASRNFANKIWNIARFIEDRIGDEAQNIDRQPDPQTIADHWVIRQLNDAGTTIGKLLAKYKFAEASDLVYKVIWNDVADWYIESSKQGVNPNMLAWVLETSLKIAHPFAPFVTETIWETLKWEEGMLITSRWPEPAKFNEIDAAEFEQLKNLVSEIRFITAELEVKQTLVYKHDTLINEYAELIRALARLKTVEQSENPKGLRLAVQNREAWLDIDPETLYHHQTKLETRLKEVRGAIERFEARLNNEGYVKNAPGHVVTETRDLLKEQKELENRLVRELEVIT